MILPSNITLPRQGERKPTLIRWASLFFAAAIVLVIGIGCSTAATNAWESWYPLSPGDSWTYQNQALEGDSAHPESEIWTNEETVITADRLPDPDAVLIALANRVLADRLSPGYFPSNDLARHEPPQIHLLEYQDDLYVLDGLNSGAASCAPVGNRCASPLDGRRHLRPAWRDALVRGEIPPDLCFPMRDGMVWGQTPSTSPAKEWVWTVKYLNPGMFHLQTHVASGTSEELWFSRGIGIVRELTEHHGTFDEYRRRLLRATIAGRTMQYNLETKQPAALSRSDCESIDQSQVIQVTNGAWLSPRRSCIAGFPK